MKNDLLLQRSLMPIDREETGTDSLTIGRVRDINKLTAYGKCVQSNLPPKYTELDGVTNNASTLLDTGIIPIIDDVEFELRVIPSTGSWYIFQSRNMNVTAIYGISGSMVGETILFGWNGNRSLLQSNISRDPSHTYYIKATAKNGNATLYVKDETTNTEDTKTTTYTYTSSPTSEICFWGNHSSNYVNSGNKIFFARLKVEGSVVLDYIPAKYGNDVGFYDRVSGTFKEVEVGSLVAGSEVVPSPSNPIDIWCNNGVLKARYQSGLPLEYTLLEYIESTRTQYIDTGIIQDTLEFLVDMDISFSDVNTRPGFGVSRNSPMYFCRASDGRFEQNQAYTTVVSGLDKRANLQWGKNPSDNRMKLSVVVDDQQESLISSMYGVITNQNFIIFGNNIEGEASIILNGKIYFCKIYKENLLVFDGIPVKRKSDNVLGMYDLVTNTFFTNAGTGDFIAGPVVSDPIEVYSDGTPEKLRLNNTVNLVDCADLLGIGNYIDSQDIFTGNISRNIGIIVLKGTESFDVQNATDYPTVYYYRSGSYSIYNSLCICTHYKGLVNSYSLSTIGNNQIKYGDQSQLDRIYIRDDRFNNDVQSFKNYLADQYAAGTPVIVVYPLETPGQETSEPQHIDSQIGTNTIDVSQASLGDLDFKVRYRQK